MTTSTVQDPLRQREQGSDVEEQQILAPVTEPSPERSDHHDELMPRATVPGGAQ